MKRESFLSYQRQYNNTVRKEKYLKETYGLTLKEYDNLLEKQGGVCKICGKLNVSGQRLSVDHSHKTGKVRGLLCINCNLALGYLQDNSELAMKVVLYLQE